MSHDAELDRLLTRARNTIALMEFMAGPSFALLEGGAGGKPGSKEPPGNRRALDALREQKGHLRSIIRIGAKAIVDLTPRERELLAVLRAKKERERCENESLRQRVREVTAEAIRVDRE